MKHLRKESKSINYIFLGWTLTKLVIKFCLVDNGSKAVAHMSINEAREEAFKAHKELLILHCATRYKNLINNV